MPKEVNMKLTKFNGECWYEDDRSLMERIKTWICWKPGEEWTPMSFFGHRISVMPFGFDLRLKGRPALCIHLLGHHPEDLAEVVSRLRKDGLKAFHIYVSYDCTPGSAHLWIHNPPMEVEQMAKNRERPSAEGVARGNFSNRRYVTDAGEIMEG
jgi:hypothetical protein